MTAPKAFLCSLDGTHNFPITQRITTIGRENCDIIINTGNIDIQHALIEFIEDENCYFLQDLNTSGGTFVNDCRIQNATVRLVEQDTIKFGLNGNPFQFIVQSQFIAVPNITLAGVNRSSNQSLQVITQTLPSRGNRNSVNQQNSGVLLSNQYPNGSLITINNQTQPYTICPVASGTKPPASLRSRPITANIDTRPRASSWVKGHTNSSSFNAGSGDNFDSETYRVDDNEVSSRVVQLERELKIKSIEIRDLREKVAFYKNQSGQGSTSELDQIKRDKSIAVGLVNTMQKDLSNKDCTISKLAREIEGFKREAKDKDTTIRELGEQLKLATDNRLKSYASFGDE
ncbi:forkhead-associated domain-containing 1-like [Brachionus plicatilis]|uniref:Forkhead-associated domain-containing 1-like n=1 Tax=Brachionus plicatilis TaxID=10195 RepID=A0A3M7QNK3_BRAPC|nr:forkhead-associated domain-containing 1-like [Brachionus plicatilis]